MCGIVGFSGKDKFNPKWIELLLIWNSLERGEDATGIFSPLNGLKKSLMRGSQYVLYKQNQIIKDNYFIGHVRAGTIGDKTDVNNAHPFDRGNFILAHNGTLYNHWDLLEKYNLTRADYSVDSDVLAGCIAETNNISTVIKEIAGAAALLIHDKRTPTVLNVYRKGGANGSERPLYRGLDSKGNMYISSLAEPLWFIGLDNVKPFKEDTLYTIENGGITSNAKIKNTPYYKPVAYNNVFNRHSNTQINYALNDTWKDLNIRCKSALSINFMNQKPVLNLEVDKYYLCKYTDPTKPRNVIVIANNNEYSVAKSLFNFEDLIRVNDFVKVNHDIVDSMGTIEADKGDILSVDSLWANDQQIRGKFLKDNTTLRYLDKSHFTKLTKEEAAEVYKNSQLALFDPNTIIMPPANTVVNEEEDEDTPNEKDGILVSYSEMEAMFSILDDKLEKLKEGIMKGSDRIALADDTNELLDNVFTARALFLEPKMT